MWSNQLVSPSRSTGSDVSLQYPGTTFLYFYKSKAHLTPFALLVIVFAFTIGTLINRRRLDRDDDVDSCERGSEDSSSRPTSPLLKPGMRAESGEVSRINSKLLVRFYNTFPFLAEIWYWNATYWYEIVFPTL